MENIDIVNKKKKKIYATWDAKCIDTEKKSIFWFQLMWERERENDV